MKAVREWLWAFFAVVFLVLYIRECRRKMPPDCPEIISQTKTDTAKGSTAPYIPKPVPVKIEKPKQTSAAFNPFRLKKRNDQAVSKIHSKENPLLRIPDSLQSKVSLVRDTLALGDRGRVMLEDIVMGTILSRSYRYEVYNTSTTNTVLEQKRAKWYVGMSASGTKVHPVEYAGFDVGFQGKKSKTLYTFGLGTMNNSPAFRFGAMIQLNK